MPNPEGVEVPEGTLDVVQACDTCAKLATGASTGKKYYVKGWIVAIDEGNATAIENYGNAIFTIATTTDERATKRFIAYQVMGKNGEKINRQEMVQLGDFVVIYGELMNYNGTAETVGMGTSYIYASNNPELYRAYQQMFNDMNQLYLEQAQADGKASAIYVSKNGETKMIYDIAAYNREQQSNNGYYLSVTTRILNTMKSLRLDQTNMRVTLDAEGRLLASEGTVRIMVTDLYGVEHTLDIAFNATAGSYGSSEVETFDPEAYNVVSSQEYYENYEKYATITKGDQETPAPDSAEGDDSYKLPDTVTFNGVKYQVTLDESING